MKVPFLDYAVILIYILAFIAIGAVITKKKVKSAADYSTASRGMGLFTVVGSTVATCMGATIIFGNFQLVYSSGIKGLIAALTWYIGWICLPVMAGRLYDTGAISLPDYIQKRYNPLARKIASYSVLCMGISSLAAQFRSVGSMSQALGLCDANTGIIIGAIVILLFTVFSGLWGVAITDTIQSIMILAVVGFVIPIAATVVAGGPKEAIAAIDPAKLSFKGSTMTTGVFVGYIITKSFSAGAHPAYSQRVFAAKNRKVAVWGQVISIIICTAIVLVAVWPALFLNKIFPDMTDGSLFVPAFVAAYFPIGIRGLVLAVILGLLLTTGDTFLMLFSSTVTDDIIRHAKPNIEDKKLLRIGRLACVLATVGTVLMAMYIPDITRLISIGGSSFCCTVFFPLILGCYWKKINTKAVTVSMCICCPLSIIWDFFLAKPTGQSGSLIAGITSFVICVLGSLILNAREQKKASA